MAKRQMTAYLGPALRRVHRQSPWSTTVKTLLLTFIYAKLIGYSVGIAVAAATWQA